MKRKEFIKSLLIGIAGLPLLGKNKKNDLVLEDIHQWKKDSGIDHWDTLPQPIKVHLDHLDKLLKMQNNAQKWDNSNIGRIQFGPELFNSKLLRSNFGDK